MFRALGLAPLSIAPLAEPRPDSFRVVRAEHGWLLETSGEVVSVRRRLQQEVMVPRQTRSLLEDGDVLWGSRDGLLIAPEPEHREPALERRAVENWDHTAHWGVLADHLLDHGDPLGEQISAALGRRSATPLSPHTWLGTHWRHGVLRRVFISRPEWAGRVPWREALLEVLCARSGRFLEEVSIDLPRLEPEATAAELAPLAHELLTLPWPRWLTRLDFGLMSTPPNVATPQRLLEERPRLARGALFHRADHARLVLEAGSDAFALDGLRGDSLDLAEGLRLRVFPKKVLFERPQWPRYDSWPSWDFAFHDGRWFVAWRHGAPRSDDVKLNGMEFFNAALVPGDRVEIMEHLVLRFEVSAE
ncbi:MAG: hypothetical protein JNJ54_22470 [Myxococcaceae bacterium]|nr:hypothetical protein [Myxococcaceae bacterium]